MGRAAGTGLVIGLFMVAFGMTPAQFTAQTILNPPDWMENSIFKLGILIVGLVVIWLSLTYNVWSQKQKAIDGLEEDISWAIRELLNWRDPEVKSKISNTKELDAEYRKWCKKVSQKLQNRAFFTRADQLHFDRLGFVDQVVLSGDRTQDWLLSQLKLKFDRLRDIINWVQQRRR